MHASLQERWNGISLRTKITGVTVLMLTLGLLVSGIGTIAMFKPYLINQVDNELRSAQQSLSSGDGGELTNSQMSSYASASDQYFVAVLDANGHVLVDNWGKLAASDRPIVPSGLNITKVLAQDSVIFTVHNPEDSSDFRATVVPIQLNDVNGTFATVFVAVSTANVENAVATYLSIFLGFGIIVVIAGAGLTRMLVTTTFSPLRQVELTAARKSLTATSASVSAALLRTPRSAG